MIASSEITCLEANEAMEVWVPQTPAETPSLPETKDVTLATDEVVAKERHDGEFDFGEEQGEPSPIWASDEEVFTIEVEVVGSAEGIPSEFQELAESMLRLLRAVGLTGSKLALQAGDESGLLTQILQELKVVATFKVRGYLLQVLDQEISRAISAEPLLKRARGDFMSAPMARLWDGIAAMESLDQPTTSTVQQATSAVPLIPKKGRFRSSKAGAVAQGDERRDKEALCLQDCQQRLIGYLLEGDTPSARAASGSADARRALAQAIGKTRYSTANNYLKKWSRMRDWLLAARGVAWPQEVGHLLDYIFVMTDQPVAPSVPQVWLQAVQWVFKCAGFHSAEANTGNLSVHHLVVRAVDNLTAQLSVFVKPTLQAARFPTLVLAALETYLCDCKNAVFKRLHAGSLLFRAWGTLRFDDVQRLRRNTLRFTAGMVQTVLMSTKTSGPGKRVRQLPLSISEGAELLQLKWLITYLDLVQEHLPSDRSYLLSQCTSDYKRGTDKMLTYPQASALTSTIMRELTVPILTEKGWGSSEERVMPEVLNDLFGEHSPRNHLPSIMAVIESNKDKRDMLGRWRPTGSDDYMRTYRTVVGELQVCAAVALKAGEGARRLHEADIIERATRFLIERKGLSDLQAAEVSRDWGEVLLAFSKKLGEVKENSIDLTADAPIFPSSTKSDALVSELHSPDLQREAQKVTRSARYLVVYNRSGTTARLHRSLNGCYWAGLEIRDSQCFDEVDDTMYSSRCKFCFPQLLTKKGVVVDSETESESSDYD